MTDEFNSDNLGLQWQWHANPEKEWASLLINPGNLRLYAVQNLTQNGNLWFVPNLLLQKFPSPAFTVTTKMTMYPDQPDEKAGLVVMGEEWAYVAMTPVNDGIKLVMCEGRYDKEKDGTRTIDSVTLESNSCYLKVDVDSTAQCIFSYSQDAKTYHKIGLPFKAKKGRWIGAKVGLFYVNPNVLTSQGYADFDWVRVE